MNTRGKITSVFLLKEQIRLIIDEMKKEGCSKSEVIRRAVNRYFRETKNKNPVRYKVSMRKNHYETRDDE